jgi:hypothetical protein
MIGYGSRDRQVMVIYVVVSSWATFQIQTLVHDRHVLLVLVQVQCYAEVDCDPLWPVITRLLQDILE